VNSRFIAPRSFRIPAR